MIRPLHYTLVTLALMAAPVAARAETAATAPPKQETVSYADLDLSREAGAKILIARMQAAAERVCGPAPVLADLKFHAIYTHCVRETVQRSVASVDSAVVAKVYSGLQSVAQN